MRSLVALFAMSLSGCLLYFDDGGKSCDLPADFAEPAPLRNPQTLTCDSFGGSQCDPSCGPCPPALESQDLAPIPSWGSCGSFCEGLDEGSCALEASCRVVKDIHCAIGDVPCATDFLGCFPTDNITDRLQPCALNTDGDSCSRNAACTAFHRQGSALRTSPQLVQEFVLCMDEGRTPGRCFEPVACDALPPKCPSGTTPGVVDLCWSGACIPDDLCEGPTPQPL
jgi:hypothetical protein